MGTGTKTKLIARNIIIAKDKNKDEANLKRIFNTKLFKVIIALETKK